MTSNEQHGDVGIIVLEVGGDVFYVSWDVDDEQASSALWKVMQEWMRLGVDPETVKRRSSGSTKSTPDSFFRKAVDNSGRHSYIAWSCLRALAA